MNQAELEILKSLISIVKCHNGKFSDLDIKILKGVYEIVNALEEPERWITVKGNHIPIFKGQTPQQAIEKFYQKQNQTIAGVKRGKPMSFVDANRGRVNPNYNKSREYHRNCQSCVAVFEARIRGYNIEVLPRNKKTEKVMKELSHKPFLAYIDKTTGKHPDFIKATPKNAQECLNWLYDNIKQGERYAFGFSPEGQGFNGHIVEVIKNADYQIMFYDPQKGEAYNSKYLNKIDYRAIINGKMEVLPVHIFRTDNTDIDTKILDKISKPAQ